MSILDHAWGQSAAADRVWAQVSGLAPSKAGARVFVVLQAYIDDSRDEDGTFVLGGYVATAEAWARFSREWEELLPLANLGPNLKRRFKMRDMAENPGRLRNVPAFYRVIESHVICAISCIINVNDLKRALPRIVVPNYKIDWGNFQNPYLVAFRGLIDMFHSTPHRGVFQGLFPLDSKVDFYFDTQTESRVVHNAWRMFMDSREDDVRARFGSEPRFEDDEEFLPLQAADFWAWWVRKWSAEGALDKKIRTLDFGSWEPRRGYSRLTVEFNEDQLIDGIIAVLRPQLPSGIPIFVMPKA